MSTAHADSFVTRRDKVVNKVQAFKIEEEEARRTEFQKLIRDILSEDRETGFYLLGDAAYKLDETKGTKDWRLRDINRLLTRYREDRPIEDAKRWAKTALVIALIALASSFVSAIADFKEAKETVACWLGNGAPGCEP